MFGGEMTDNIAIVTVEKVVQGGKGLGRLNGLVILVERALPGEEVQVRLHHGKGMAAGLLMEILSPSPTRMTPDCPFYDQCGGCDFRHTDYKTELSIKSGILKDTFQRIGKIALSPDGVTVVPSPGRNRYRIRTRIQCRHGRKGFFAKASHDIIPVDDCLLMPKHLIPLLRNTRCRNSFYLESHPFDNIGFRYRKTGELEPIYLNFPAYTLMHQPGTFIQANRLLLQKFIEIVLKLAGKGDTAWELFAGSGFLTLALARHFSQIHAMEWSRPAVSMLENSLQINEITNVSLSEGDCNNWEPEDCDTLILDPPRQGITTELAGRINDSRIPAIVYVSCNAATLARDLQRLNHYQTDNSVLIDMFPGTAHFETIVRLTRK